MTEATHPRNLRELYDRIRNSDPAYLTPSGRITTKLPNFGGEPPARDHAARSWDDQHMLIGSRPDNAALVRRYQPPTAAEFRALLAQWSEKTGDQMTGRHVASLVDVDPRNVRRWQSDKDGEPRVPYPVLFTLAVKCSGVQVSREEWRRQLGVDA